MTDVIVTLMLVYCLADVVPCGVVQPPLVARGYFCLPMADVIAIGQNKKKTNLYMVVPYHEGLGERIKRTCNKFGVQVFFKGGQTIRSLPMAPKDKDPITNKSGVIYRYKCSELVCNEEYIGESARNFAERFKEHQRTPSPIFDHCNTTSHNININNFTIVGREDQNLTRAIKEALFIRVNDPSLNRNIGKYHLPHIWDEVLHKTSELKLKD